MVLLIKSLFKLAYFLLGLIIIYTLLIVYLNTSYNKYLISNMLSKILPGKFYIEKLSVTPGFNKIKLKNLSIIAPKGEKVIEISNLTLNISPLTLIKSIISSKKLIINSTVINKAKINIIINKDYKNIAETFYTLDKHAKFRKLIFNKMYKNNFMFFDDSEFISNSKPSKKPLTILLNNLSINKSTVILTISDKIKIKSNDINFKNASFQLLKDNILIRGDGNLTNALIEIQDKKLRIDKAEFYSYEQNFDYISLKQAFLHIKDSEFDTKVKLDMDILSKLNISLNGNLKTSIIKSIAKENKIKIPEKIELGKNVTVEANLFGSTNYPMVNFNLLVGDLKFDNINFKKGSLEAYYQAEQSDVSLYLREINYKDKKIKRFRTNLSINNKDTVNLENLSFEANSGTLKISSNMNFLSGKIEKLNLKIKNFIPDYIKDFLPVKIPLKYKHLTKGIFYTNINLTAEDIYKQKNINLNMYSSYKLTQKEIIGKTLEVKTRLKYNQGFINIYRGTYLKSDNLSFITNGKLNINKKNASIQFDIRANKFEGILREFDINDFSGNIAFKGNVIGSFHNPLLKANIHLSDFNYLHYKNNDISTDIKLENGLIQLYGLSVANNDFKSFITAKVKLYKKNLNKFLKEPQFSLFVNLENAKIGNIIQNDKVNLNLNTEVIIYGTPSNLNGTITSYSKNFTINNEPFDDFNLSMKLTEDPETSNNILNIQDFEINKNKSKFLKLIGDINLTTMDYNIEALIPRLKLGKIANLQINNKSLFNGDAISSLFLNGNIKKKTVNYNLNMRLASCYYPYEIETTKTQVEPSDEFGVADKITFKKVKLNKKLKLGEGLLSIKGNQNQAVINGKLFKIISLESNIKDILTHPILTVNFDVNKFPADKFYTAPIKSLITLNSELKYDLLDKKILFGRIVFEDIDLNLGDLNIKQSSRKLKSNDKHCILTVDNKKVKKNCIEYLNNKLYVDLGVSFLEEHINFSGIIFPDKERMNLNVYGGINLKSFAYFKNIFSSIDGNAYIYSNISGTFKKPRYNFNLKIKNASFQPVGYDKDITIDNAQITMRQDKVYIRNIKGNMLGGNFEITGDPNNNNQIFNLSNQNIYLNLNANNLEYNLPEVADIETSLDLTLKGNIKNLKLYGKTKIIDGKFYKEINIVDNILNPITQKTEVYEEGIDLKTIPLLKNISLDINIINEGLIISNNLMSDVAVKANLTILGTLGSPIIIGEITAKDGSVNLLRNTFDLTDLGIKFNKTDLLASKLNFEAESIIKDYDPVSDEYTNRNVSLIITGKLNNPKVELTGEGLTKVQTLMLLLTGQSGLNTSGTTVNEDRGSKITNQVFSILLQNSLNKLTSDFTKQTDISIQTSINSSGGLSVSANKRIAERVIVSGVGEFENNTLQKEISAEVIITDQLVIEILKAFEAGTTDLGLKYRLKLK